MKPHTLPISLSVLALLIGCSKDEKPSAISGADVKSVLLTKLRDFQGQADGLYAISNGVLRVGAHAIFPMPVIESRVSRQGKSIVAMRIEMSVDGAPRPEAAFGAIGIADSNKEAIAVGLGEWYLGFALPFFQALAERKPSLDVGDYEVFAGVLNRGKEEIGLIEQLRNEADSGTLAKQ